MKTEDTHNANTLPPAAYVLGTTVLVGGIASVAGFYGGFLLYPDSNLAPLLCLPTGGAGILVGMVLGVALSAFRKTAHSLHIEFRWLAAVWALTLSVSIFLDCDLLFVNLQILPPLLGLIILTNKCLRPNIPKRIRRLWPVYLLAALLFLITSLFPPVTHNKWMPVERRPVYTETNPMPKFLFCNSLRLDASRSYAELGVDSSQLLLEWLGITAVTGLLSVGFGKNRSKK